MPSPTRDTRVCGRLTLKMNGTKYEDRSQKVGRGRKVSDGRVKVRGDRERSGDVRPQVGSPSRRTSVVIGGSTVSVT